MICLSVFPFDDWDGLCVLIRPVPGALTLIYIMGQCGVSHARIETLLFSFFFIISPDPCF